MGGVLAVPMDIFSGIASWSGRPPARANRGSYTTIHIQRM
jgi:hypothetical protein